MTRSTSLALVLYLPAVGLQLVGCGKPVRREAQPESHKAVAEVDRRPDAGPSTFGDDVTEEVREQNVSAKLPPTPTRRGQASITTAAAPRVTRTAHGFVARLDSLSVPTPAYHRGRVVVGAHSAYQIHAFDAESGAPAWSLRLSDDGPTEPTCKDGICVFNTYSCTMFGVDVASGKPLWNWWLGSPQLATPVIQGDLVFSSYPNRGRKGPQYVVGAFDLKTGAPAWQRWIDAEVNATPVSDGKFLYVATTAGTLYQFSAREGDVVAVHKNRVASPPVLASDGVFFARDEILQGDDDALAASRVLFPFLERARMTAPITPRPRPLVAGHRLFTVEQGVVVATNRRTGQRIWAQRPSADEPAEVGSPLLYAGKSVLLATKSGNVVRMEPDTGAVMESFAVSDGPLSSQPIAVNGWLYAGTRRGELVGFDTGRPELTGWEMLGGGPDRRGSADDEEGT
jgi:outer membrane protein assembly factor BamB